MVNNNFDEGEIIDVKRFKISYKNCTLEKLIKMTHQNILLQAKRFIINIHKKQQLSNKNFKWKRKAYTKKEFEIARKINLTDSKSTILKKIKAFSYKDYESIYINFKGFKFDFKK